MASTFRRVWRWLLPFNIAKPDDLTDEGAFVAHTISTLLDLTLTRAREGLNARFPTRAGASANELTAGDRGLPRGRSETAAAHATRLKAWRTPRTHRVRGNAYELLEQIRAYWGAGGIKVRTIANGVEHVINTSGTYSKATVTFDWDSADPGYDSARWARAWVNIFPNPAIEVLETPAFGDVTLWGGALGTPGYTLGQTGVTPADVLAMRNLFQQGAWHPEHVQMEWLIISLGPLLPSPDGTWHNWSRNNAGNQEATRSRDCRYVSLDPNYNNRYSGNPESFATTSDSVDGGTYGPGDPTNAAAWGSSTLPSGASYLGDSASFPVDVLLMDDGSLPQ